MRAFPSSPSAVFVFALAAIAPLAAQDDPAPLPDGPAIAFVEAFPGHPGFDRPLYVAFTATDPAHAYVCTQPGRVFAVPRAGAQNGPGRLFLDMSAVVFTDNWEEGLLGFQFDPKYADNGHVWVCWSEKKDGLSGAMGNGKVAKSNRQSIVARYTARKTDAGPVVDLASELRVLEVFQPFGNHNGGTIEFGPDGMLYVAFGDGGAANDPFLNAQSRANLLGKVLRLDVRAATADKPYAIPADNPWPQVEGVRPEIWCYGLRNPWRITFDRATGDLWCGDVGQNRLEEVDRLVKGGNYGWNALEAGEVFKLRKGRDVPAGAIAPVASYPHSEGLSITGGYVYRGKKIAGLDGWFVYGDFMTLRMWACKEDRQGGAHAVVRLAGAPQQVASFAEEPDGELLLAGFDGRQGKVYRLVPAPAAGRDGGD
jgi:glucose/arabinose dehydrogenase